MPKALERKLLAIAESRHYSKKRKGAFVYGNETMQAYRKKKKRKK